LGDYDLPAFITAILKGREGTVNEELEPTIEFLVIDEEGDAGTTQTKWQAET
jgi:hypothetical protein